MHNLEHDVTIVGCGPAGMMLGGELALAGVDVAIVERRENQEVEGSRASGLHARSLEILDQRGIADRFIQQGTKHYGAPIAGTVIDTSDLPSRHNYTLALWQEKIEHTLFDWISELGVSVYRRSEAVRFRQDSDHVRLELHDARTISSRYLVGCDGGRSGIRKMAGIGFSGHTPTCSSLIFEAEMEGEAPLGLRYGEHGTSAIGKLEDGVRLRGVVGEETLTSGDGPSEDDLRAALVAAYGSDFGVHNITWLSRFTDAARLATSYREGRVLLAGDAAHVHSPVGGQGLNIGLQDAFNLGWKLAQVVKGVSPDRLLDTYHAERHPIGAALLQTTLALSGLARGGARAEALRSWVARLIRMDEPRRCYGANISGLDIRYDLGDGHPLLGRRMPDVDLITTEGPRRIFELLHDGRPILLSLGGAGMSAKAMRAESVMRVGATCAGICSLPVVGPVEMPTAILVRPDGHVAWTGDGEDEDLDAAIQCWFGPGG